MNYIILHIEKTATFWKRCGIAALLAASVFGGVDASKEAGASAPAGGAGGGGTTANGGIEARVPDIMPTSGKTTERKTLIRTASAFQLIGKTTTDAVDESAYHVPNEKILAEGLLKLKDANVFAPYYDPYFDRVVFDISYPALLEALEKSDKVKVNAAAMRSIETIKNLGEWDDNAVSKDSPEEKALGLFEFYNSIDDTEKERPMLDGSDRSIRKYIFGNLLKIIWETETGKQRLKSLMLLQAVSGLVFTKKIKKIKIIIDEKKDMFFGYGATGSECGDLGILNLDDKKMFAAEKDELYAAILLHELGHLYHDVVIPFRLDAHYTIPNRDKKFFNILFPAEVKQENIKEFSSQLIKEALEFCKAKRIANKTCDQKHLTQAAEDTVRKIVKQVFEWHSLEEMLTITGVALIDLPLKPATEEKTKSYKYIITDNQSENMHIKRKEDVDKHPFPYRTSHANGGFIRSSGFYVYAFLREAILEKDEKLEMKDIENHFHRFFEQIRVPSQAHLSAIEWKKRNPKTIIDREYGHKVVSILNKKTLKLSSLDDERDIPSETYAHDERNKRLIPLSGVATGNASHKANDIHYLVNPEGELTIDSGVYIGEDLDLSKHLNIKALEIKDGCKIIGKLTLPSSLENLTIGDLNIKDGLDLSGCSSLKTIKYVGSVRGWEKLQNYCKDLSKIHINKLSTQEKATETTFFQKDGSFYVTLEFESEALKDDLGWLSPTKVECRVDKDLSVDLNLSNCKRLKTLNLYGHVKICGKLPAFLENLTLSDIETGDFNLSNYKQLTNVELLDVKINGQLTLPSVCRSETQKNGSITGGLTIYSVSGHLDLSNCPAEVFILLGHLSENESKPLCGRFDELSLPESLETLTIGNGGEVSISKLHLPHSLKTLEIERDAKITERVLKAALEEFKPGNKKMTSVTVKYDGIEEATKESAMELFRSVVEDPANNIHVDDLPDDEEESEEEDDDDN